MREGIGSAAPRPHHLRMFTARPATITTVAIEASASIIMSTLARDVSGMVSVGLNAVAFVNERQRWSTKPGIQFVWPSSCAAIWGNRISGVPLVQVEHEPDRWGDVEAPALAGASPPVLLRTDLYHGIPVLVSPSPGLKSAAVSVPWPPWNPSAPVPPVRVSLP